jgi:hypothetical protein
MGLLSHRFGFSLLVSATITLPACGVDEAGRDENTSFSEDGSSSDSDDGVAEDSAEDGDASGDGSTSDDGSEMHFDVGFEGDVPMYEGCEKVDFLFVIDSSGSMRTHQEHLIGAFPGFIDSITSTLDEAQDYHVLVTDTDENSAEVCQWWCDVDSPFCDYECGDDQNVWDDCDRTFGSGVVHPLGLESSNQSCGFQDDRRYLTTEDEDLQDKFACAAQIGANHTDEWQMDALTAAVSPEINGEDGCNEGFLRDDAILVLTLITDEPDTMSAGDLADWYEAVVNAKGGNEEAVVMLGIISDRDLPNAVCDNLEGFPHAAPDMQEFVGNFPNHAKLSICEDQDGYMSFFQEAVDLVADTCDAFPAG